MTSSGNEFKVKNSLDFSVMSYYHKKNGSQNFFVLKRMREKNFK